PTRSRGVKSRTAPVPHAGSSTATWPSGARGSASPVISTKFARRAARNVYAAGHTLTVRPEPVTSTSFTTAPVPSSAGFAPTTATPGSTTSAESLRASVPSPALVYRGLTYSGSHAAHPRRTGSARSPPGASAERRKRHTKCAHRRAAHVVGPE